MVCAGRGSSRRELEQHIASCGLKEDFLLLGAVTNPYPYYRQTDIYVHATGYEGKSIAIQEAQTLGCAIVASECNREQITDGEDGILCALDAAAVKEAVGFLIRNPDRRQGVRAGGVKASCKLRERGTAVGAAAFRERIRKIRW